jgi:hypothetical protein
MHFATSVLQVRESLFCWREFSDHGKQTDEYRTRNVEGGRRKSPRKGARRHEKPGLTDFDLASLPSRITSCLLAFFVAI